MGIVGRTSECAPGGWRGGRRNAVGLGDDDLNAGLSSGEGRGWRLIWEGERKKWGPALLLGVPSGGEEGRERRSQIGRSERRVLERGHTGAALEAGCPVGRAQRRGGAAHTHRDTRGASAAARLPRRLSGGAASEVRVIAPPAHSSRMKESAHGSVACGVRLHHAHRLQSEPTVQHGAGRNVGCGDQRNGTGGRRGRHSRASCVWFLFHVSFAFSASLESMNSVGVEDENKQVNTHCSTSFEVSTGGRGDEGRRAAWDTEASCRTGKRATGAEELRTGARRGNRTLRGQRERQRKKRRTRRTLIARKAGKK